MQTNLFPFTRNDYRAFPVFVAVMLAAAAASDALARAIDRYLRLGGLELHKPGSHQAFQDMCSLAEHYTAATRDAEPWHYGTIPAFTTSHAINLDNRELRAFLRDLQGSIIYRSSRDPQDPRRVVSAPVCTDNGIAGYFRSEVRSMTVIPRTGHFPWLDDPERYWAVITDFIRTRKKAMPSAQMSW